MGNRDALSGRFIGNTSTIPSSRPSFGWKVTGPPQWASPYIGAGLGFNIGERRSKQVLLQWFLVVSNGDDLF